MKRFLMTFAAVIVAIVTFGQQPLPNDPAVKVGKLENGLTYYIRHNAQPAQRAEFYLATNVGAFQEADDQDGLAHFLEHMCFNGTKNFPGKGILEYLQSIGAEFGRNINASTGFEQTSYMLNNIPVIREGIVDTCLMILRDYSHYVTCDPKEIDAERGVILEERRSRRTADWRMLEQSLPYYFGDTQMARRTLIGGEEQLKTFKYESLTNFYRTWYHPDMQAVVVVGDVDVDKIEAKIKNIFGEIPAPAQPTVKPLIQIPENVNPEIAILTDPEATSSMIEILWRFAPVPREMRNTDMAFVNDLVKSIVGRVMDERFHDITSKPDAPFLMGQLMIGGLCESADAVQGTVMFKDGEALKAFEAYMIEVEKMRRYGFTEGEIERAKEKIISRLEKAVSAAESRKNSELAGTHKDGYGTIASSGTSTDYITIDWRQELRGNIKSTSARWYRAAYKRTTDSHTLKCKECRYCSKCRREYKRASSRCKPSQRSQVQKNDRWCARLGDMAAIQRSKSGGTKDRT